MLSSKFSDTRVLSISTKGLVLPRCARCILSRLRCSRHGLLLSSCLSGIGGVEGPTAGAYPRATLILFCAVQLLTL